MTVIFFGTSSFAVPILEALFPTQWRPRIVVTTPERPAGRGLKPRPSPVKQKALEYGLEVWEPVRFAPNKVEVLNNHLAWNSRDQKGAGARGGPGWADRMAALAPDLFILAAYGKIIPRTVLAVPKAGSLNVHPSLLPRWRGPAPIQYAILNGDSVTGVTIMAMDEEVDHGPILAQSSVAILPDDTSETLEKKLCREGARLLLETLPSWSQGNITPRRQDHAKATYTHLLTKENGAIDWSFPAVDIARRIRAFTPWPGTHTFWNENGGRRITIVRAIPDSSAKTPENPIDTDQEPGSVFSKEKRLLVAAGNGALEVLELQLEGKRAMNGKEFLNGYRTILGARLSKHPKI